MQLKTDVNNRQGHCALLRIISLDISTRMEKRVSRSKPERREIHSVCMTVPTIILNASSSDNHAGLQHSRSAGDLELSPSDTDALKASRKQEGRASFSGTVADDMQDVDSRNAIGLYCSPRLPRRSVNSEMSALQRQPGGIMESLNACNLNSLDPGSRVGSSVSLNSEYTARSVGLISNDSSSELSQHFPYTGLLEGSYQKHSVLKRFYSSPEKDEDLLQTMTNVRRNSKSMGNMQDEADSTVYFDFGSDSTEDPQGEKAQARCDLRSDLARGCLDEPESNETPAENNLVTSKTGGASLREGRIRKWLTEISGPDENSHSNG